MSEYSAHEIAAWLECFPEKSSWCRNEQVCQGVMVKRFERSNGLDTALYKNIPLLSHIRMILINAISTIWPGFVRWFNGEVPLYVYLSISLTVYLNLSIHLSICPSM